MTRTGCQPDKHDLDQYHAIQRYLLMLGPQYRELWFSHALRDLDAPPPLDYFDDAVTETDVTKIGVLMHERRPAI